MPQSSTNESNPSSSAIPGAALNPGTAGKRSTRENLLAARRGQEILAPMLISGSVNAYCFETWLVQWLIPSFKNPAIIILDNAPIHRKNVVREIVQEAGHQVQFLPKYSPDFNKIEHDFAAIKKRRQYRSEEVTLDEIIKDYCSRNQNNNH